MYCPLIQRWRTDISRAFDAYQTPEQPAPSQQITDAHAGQQYFAETAGKQNQAGWIQGLQRRRRLLTIIKVLVYGVLQNRQMIPSSNFNQVSAPVQRHNGSCRVMKRGCNVQHPGAVLNDEVLEQVSPQAFMI